MMLAYLISAVAVLSVVVIVTATGNVPIHPTHETSPPPTLSLSFSPSAPSWPDNTPVGTTIARAFATWSNGATFTGTYSLPDNDGGICTINGNQIILGKAFPSGSSVQNCVVTAAQ